MTHFIPCHKNDDASHVPLEYALYKATLSTTFHPQTDGQTEVSLKDWIPLVEFSYNRVFNFTTSYSPFELAYAFNPLFPLDLFHLFIFPNCVNDEGLSKAQFFQRLRDKA
ncbi:hypothetical protein CR513_06339, partial [Mucuna pruriens]